MKHIPFTAEYLRALIEELRARGHKIQAVKIGWGKQAVTVPKIVTLSKK